jgi:hypothetical protein
MSLVVLLKDSPVNEAKQLTHVQSVGAVEMIIGKKQGQRSHA